MPAHKRSLPDDSNSDDGEGGEEPRQPQSSSPPAPPHQNGNGSFSRPVRSEMREEDVEEEEDEDSEEEDEKQEEEEEEDDEEDADADEEDDELAAGTDESQSMSSEEEEEEEEEDEGEKPEFVYVELPEIRKDVQCPICLGIIKKTRTVMECLHRFCRECIDKSMRLGNNECPACRTHCASRRSLRDDPNYDALIAALYPDIDKYEEEELAFHEEEKTRNKQIQASIAQIFQRQSEALARRRTNGKESTTPYSARSQRNLRTTQSRRQRNRRNMDYQGSEDNEEENEDVGGKDSSSADERSPEVRPRRRRRRPGMRTSQPSSSGMNSEGGAVENDQETSRDWGVSPALVRNTEMLAWGRGGTRSNTRHGVASSSSNRHARSNRVSRLAEHLKNTSVEDKNEDESYMNLIVIPLEKESTPSLEQPYICCRSTSSVGQLREFIAQRLSLEPEQVDLFIFTNFYDLSPTPPSRNAPLQLDDNAATLATITSGYIRNPTIYLPRSYWVSIRLRKVEVVKTEPETAVSMEAEASCVKEESKEMTE
ncbi:Putative E3 ubiquitin-protein ligase RING1a [Linum perenne]